MENYDLIIIGSGPAGLTAGIYGARAMMKTLVLEKAGYGGQIIVTQDIDNYPPFYENMSGMKLMIEWHKHAEHAGAEVKRDGVVSCRVDGDYKILTCESGTEYRTKALIIATGARPRKLGAAGEKHYTGRGVSYCATCDGGFFKDMEIAVVGGGNSAVEEAVYLTRFASKVTIVTSSAEGELSASRSALMKAMQNEKIEWRYNSVVEEIVGDERRLESLALKNTVTGEKENLIVRGTFIFVGTEPIVEAVSGFVAADENGYIITNENLETDIPGVFAAGDVRVNAVRQVITAAADGATAAINAEKYVEEIDLWEKQVANAAASVVILFYRNRDEQHLAENIRIEQLAEKAGCVVIKKPVPRNENLARRYGMQSFPGVLLVNEDEYLTLPYDALNEETFEKWLKK